MDEQPKMDAVAIPKAVMDHVAEHGKSSQLRLDS